MIRSESNSNHKNDCRTYTKVLIIIQTWDECPKLRPETKACKTIATHGREDLAQTTYSVFHLKAKPSAAKCRRFDGNESRANAADFISTSNVILWTLYLLTISINIGNADKQCRFFKQPLNVCLRADSYHWEWKHLFKLTAQNLHLH